MTYCLRNIIIVAQTLTLLNLFADPLEKSQLKAATAPFSVLVSILPLKGIVDEVGGERVKSLALVESGQSPELFELKPRQMRLATQHELLFLLGGPFEKHWAPRLKDLAPGLKLVPVGDKYRSRLAEDPHIWLDPEMAIGLAETVLVELVARDESNGQYYRDHFEKFRRELQAVDRELKAKFSDLKQRTFVTDHPAWGHFARRYGLRQLSLEREGKPIGPAEFHQLIRTMKEDRVRVVVEISSSGGRMAGRLAKLTGAETLRLDPLAPDLVANLRGVGQTLAQALEKP